MGNSGKWKVTNDTAIASTQNIQAKFTNNKSADLWHSVGPGAYDPNGTLKAKTSDIVAQSATIYNLRKAFRLQEWLERNATAGTRYIESILAHFGWRTRDYRLQRPEFVCGSSQPLVISEVLQTSNSVTGSAQGNMPTHKITPIRFITISCCCWY